MATAVIGGLVAAGGAALSGAAIGGVIAAGVLAAGSTLLQERAQERRQEAVEAGVEEQRRQQAIQNAQQDVARTRAIRQTIAQARVDRAEIEQRAFTGGPEGVGQSIAGDTATAVGAANTQRAAAFGVAQSQDRQAQFAVDAQSSNRFDVLAGITNAGLTGVNLFNQGAFDNLGGLFNFGNSATPVADSRLSSSNVFAGGTFGR